MLRGEVDFSRGKTTVEIGSVAELMSTLELLIREMEEGDLGAQIEAANFKLREGFGKSSADELIVRSLDDFELTCHQSPQRRDTRCR